MGELLGSDAIFASANGVLERLKDAAPVGLETRLTRYHHECLLAYTAIVDRLQFYVETFGPVFPALKSQDPFRKWISSLCSTSIPETLDGIQRKECHEKVEWSQRIERRLIAKQQKVQETLRLLNPNVEFKSVDHELVQLRAHISTLRMDTPSEVIEWTLKRSMTEHLKSLWSLAVDRPESSPIEPLVHIVDQVLSTIGPNVYIFSRCVILSISLSNHLSVYSSA